MLIDVVFYAFAAVLIAGAIGVISVRNPVHAVLLLIMTFFTAAGLFVLLGAEFLAMILVIVYVGAVAVLFLFVVMMMDVDFTALRQGFLTYLPLGLLVGAVLLAQLLTVAFLMPERTTITPISAQDIGRVLYTVYVYPFQTAGIILLVAMIGAIALTLRRRTDVRRQDIGAQTARKPADVLKLITVGSGQGGESFFAPKQKQDPKSKSPKNRS
ncbi:MAG: NADH-quinone oxidoreductase subunit J [Pseudomonadota bacterium]